MTLSQDVFDYGTLGQTSGVHEVWGVGAKIFADNAGRNLLHSAGEGPLSHASIEAQTKEVLASIPAGQAVFYRIAGSALQYTSPMEYGGLLVPAESDILNQISGERIVWVDSVPDTYYDFLADLPCDLFGWDCQNGPSVAEMRLIRGGRLLADSDDADVRILGKVPNCL